MHSLCMLSFCAAGFLFSLQVGAQLSAADVAAARSLGAEGVRLADKGRCREAVEKLERSEKLYHAPTTLGRLAECQIDLGKVVLGTENLQRLLREPLAPGAPPAFVAARVRAEAVLAKARLKIGNLQIGVEAPAGAKLEMTVDGAPVSDMFLDNQWPADPGVHDVEVTALGFLKATAKVTVREGEGQKVSLKLVADPDYVKASPPEASVAPLAEPEKSVPPPPPESGSSKTLAYVALGVGGAGMVVGSVAGILFLGKASDLDKACPNKTCPPTSAGDLSSTMTLGTVSTVGFIVGGVGLAAGAVLLLTGGSPKGITKVGALTPVIGPTYLGASGSF